MFDRPEESVSTDIPRPDDVCACGQPVGIRLVSVHRGDGKLILKSFSEVGYSKSSEGHVNWSSLKLHAPWIFDHWVNECWDCYHRATKPEPSRYTENQARMAWTWFLGKITAGTGYAIFQHRQATPEQEERFLLIVNQEAKRLNQPDAIPEEFRLREVWAA